MKEWLKNEKNKHKYYLFDYHNNDYIKKYKYDYYKMKINKIL